MDESGQRISSQLDVEYIKSFSRIIRYSAIGFSILFCSFGILFFTFMIITFVDDIELKYKILFCLSSAAFFICAIISAFAAITVYFNERGMLPEAPGTLQQRFLKLFNLIPRPRIKLLTIDMPASEAHSISTAAIQDVEIPEIQKPEENPVINIEWSPEETGNLPLQSDLSSISPNLERTDVPASSAEGSSSPFSSSHFTSTVDQPPTDSNLVPKTSTFSEVSGSLTEITPFDSDDLAQDVNAVNSVPSGSNELSLDDPSSESQLTETSNGKLRRRKTTGDQDESTSVTSSSEEGSPEK